MIVLSCRKDETNPNACNSENPLKMKWMTEWVGDLQHCVCTISIFQAEYNGENVFRPLMNDPLCQGIIENIPVYNCQGEQILTLNNFEDWSAFNTEGTNLRIIYSCPKN
jgi:hypothetical protein